MKPIQKIIIVGGGTAGWIAAAMFANEFKHAKIHIELIESNEIGTIGVGESTIPPFLELINTLEINEIDFIQKTQASFKLGIQFQDWRVKGESYFHPFGTMTAGMNHFRCYQLWLKSTMNGENFALQDFSPCNSMAQQGRFLLPRLAEKTPLQDASYALHLDARLVANYLRDYAEALGVIRTEGKITQVIKKEDDFIDKVYLQSGKEIGGDFFIDCSGFHALIIEKTLGVSYCDWSNYLPCDRAVAVQTANTGDTVPFTRATARDHGWTWRIPLQHRTGNGYVYASKFCSDDEAVNTLMNVVDGEALTEPRVIPFKTGVRDEIWTGNCLALGLASGFIEPLESTAIHLVVRGMVHFLRRYPDAQCDKSLVKEYNRRMKMDYEEIRDFIVLHYCLTEREDTPFWRWCKNMELPIALQETIDLFKVQGGLPEQIDPLFAPESWRSVAEGMGLRPKKYATLVDDFDFEEAVNHFKRYIDATYKFVQKLPTHDQFIAQNCPAPPWKKS